MKLTYSGGVSRCLLTLALCLGWLTPLLAADYVWVGAGLWSSTGNWAPVGTPGPLDRAIFPPGGSDCTIDIPVSVGGILMEDGYLSTVKSSKHLTIGNMGFVMEGGNFDGNFDGNTDPIDINGVCILDGGAFSTSDGGTYFGDDLHFLSSFATTSFAATGTVIFDGATTATFTYPDGSPTPDFFHVIIEKTNTWQLILQPGKDLLAYGDLILKNGSVVSASNDSELQASQNVIIDATYDPATNTSLRMRGPGSWHFVQNYNGSAINRIILDKDIVGDTVVFRSDNVTMTIGDLGDSLFIQNATLRLADNAIHDFNFRYIEFSLPGRLNANPGATLSIQGDIKCDAPDPLLTFRDFGGTVIIDGATTNYFDFNGGILDFHNFTIAKTNTWPFTLRGSSTIRVNNMATFTDGAYINGPRLISTIGNKIEARKDITVNGNYDEGNGKIVIAGPGNANFFHNKSGSSFDRTVIQKANSSDTVNFIFGSAIQGVASDTLDIQEGVAHWPDSVDVNYDMGMTYVSAGGKFAASENRMRASGSFDFNGGVFEANNGTFEFDGLHATFSATPTPDFYNFTLNKTNTWILTLPPGQIVNVQNTANFSNGGYNGSSTARIDMYGDCIVGGNFDLGTGRTRFTGSTNATFYHDRTSQSFRKVFIDKTGGAAVTFSRSSGTPVAGTVGDTLLVNSGQLNFALGANDLNYSEIIIQPGGEILAPAGSANFSGSFRNFGTFTHNSGTWIWDGATQTTYESPVATDFWNWTLNKTNTWSHFVSAGQTANVRNKATFTNGALHSNDYTGLVDVYGDIEVGGNYDTDNGRVRLVGSTNSTYFYNKTGRHFYVFDLRKTVGASVTVSSTVTPTMGTLSDTLHLVSGTLQFATATANLDYDLIEIEAAGTMIAPSGTATCSSDFTNKGGAFQHNNGNWQWDGATNKTYSSIAPTEFWDWTLNKTNTWRLSIAAGDTARVLNHSTFENGALSSVDYSGIVAAFGDVTVGGNYDPNNGRLVIMGTDTATYFHEKNGRNFYVLDVQREPGAVLNLTRASGTPILGDGGDTLRITSGEVRLTSPGTNLDYREIELEANGTLQASDGITLCSSNFRHRGGAFDHNMGTWQWDGLSTTFEADFGLDFYNTSMQKTNTWILTIAPGDTLRTKKLLTLADGTYHGLMEAQGDVVVVGNFDGHLGELILAGIDTQYLSGSLNLLNDDIVVDKDAGEVILGSVLYIDAGGQVLHLREGLIRGTTTEYVQFSDAGTWTGASALSYIAGPIRKVGLNNFTFPLGDANRYAPARIENITASSTFEVEYFAQTPLFPTAMVGPGIDHVGSSQYWDVQRLGGFSNVRLLLDSAAAFEAGVDDPSSLEIVRWDAGDNFWESEGNGGYENGMLAIAGAPGTLDGFGSVTFGSTNGNNPLDGFSPVCLIPTNLNAVTGPGSASLSWDASTDAIGYQLEGQNLSGPGSITTNLPGTSLSTSALALCNPYQFRVQAVCADTVSPLSNWEMFTTTGCGGCTVPANPRAENLTPTSATLAWDAVATALGYGITGGPVGGGSGFLITGGTSQNVSGLAPGSNYQFQVAAWCGTDTSDFSATVLFSTPTLSSKSGAGSSAGFSATVYPNPASETLFVTGQPMAGALEWEALLRDGAGRVIVQKSSRFSETLSLDVSDLPAGLYTLELVSSTTRQATQIAVQH